MSAQHARQFSRQRFLGGVTLAVTAGLLGLRPESAPAEPPPETTMLRLTQTPGTCLAPQYVAEELLQQEGFTEVQYIKTTGGGGTARALASGEAHISMTFGGPLIVRIDAGDPLVILAGGHIGCFELFGTEQVRAIREPKGKTVAVLELGGAHHIFLASMAAYVGLDPHKDITWVVHPVTEAMRLLAAGKIDAFLGFPPATLEFRAQQIG